MAKGPTPHPQLLKAAIDDRDARPWRYYRFEREQLKKFCEELADKNDAAERQLAEQTETMKAAEAQATALRSAIFELAPHPSLWEALTNEQIVRTRLISVDAFNQSRDEATALREALTSIVKLNVRRDDANIAQATTMAAVAFVEAVKLAKAALSAPPPAQAETPRVITVTADRLREIYERAEAAERQLAEIGAQMEAIQAIVEGRKPSDFLLSFPLVRAVDDLRRQLAEQGQELAQVRATTTTWECGCGAVNGVNLAECVVCRRHRSETRFEAAETPAEGTGAKPLSKAAAQLHAAAHATLREPKEQS